MMTVTTRRFGMALALLALLPLLAFSALAQEEQKDPKESPQFYRATIRVIEKTSDKEGSVVNSRDYIILLKNGKYGEIRTGNSVPLPGEKGTIYMDVGLNIDCRVRTLGAGVAVDLALELSNIASRRAVVMGQDAPITRKVRSSASTKVALGKPTTIISVNDVTSESRFEVEVTITKID